jgi:low affinity Fe/Cu permease
MVNPMKIKALKSVNKGVSKWPKFNSGKKHNDNFFERFAGKITKATGSTGAFLLALTVVLVWVFSGPAFDFSETWQLVINTGTTIVTFLMVFLIQKTQNKDSLALHLKLNELVAAHEFASNRLVDVESLTEEELLTIQKFYKKLRDLTQDEQNLQTSHSIDEAEKVHRRKMKAKKSSHTSHTSGK